MGPLCLGYTCTSPEPLGRGLRREDDRSFAPADKPRAVCRRLRARGRPSSVRCRVQGSTTHLRTSSYDPYVFVESVLLWKQRRLTNSKIAHLVARSVSSRPTSLLLDDNGYSVALGREAMRWLTMPCSARVVSE